MTHFYEKNIVEIKEEYTSFLVEITTPFIYEGFKSIYNSAVHWHKKMMTNYEKDPNKKKPPSLLKQFQTYLRGIPDLTNELISSETNRIKSKSRCAEWYDDLVKAVIKSNIILLTFSTSHKKSYIVQQKYHETVNTKDFIHKCYIECARAIYNNPELFWHGYPSLEIKRNQRETCAIIEKGILKAIRKMLPLGIILKEYLKNEYIPEKDNDISLVVSPERRQNIKNMVNKDLNENIVSILEDPDNINGFEEVKKDDVSILEESTESTHQTSPSESESIQKEIDQIEQRMNDNEIDTNMQEEKTKETSFTETGQREEDRPTTSANKIPDAIENNDVRDILNGNDISKIKDNKVKSFMRNAIDMSE